ncbi:hypothetical protein LVJ82_00805 [Vitreoscilla massiliensis]|uniref:Uncharacterized protein n=1 Tax=Vitreoscilla massiliensis TaxID=1689272 RepID=A0ABY4E2F1_9NEIS|nr:hypothetical protein [Vitreoscilla massiliensis]UOO89089.1 hypothetical protein LVJ82_16855 [Vitreoscilla massiliensis]UOO89555.1 hypothetical protein LVJ82_00805 [Vitreoscilla massiliensis]
MITGFNKKELRQFEHYRKQWVKETCCECDAVTFLHEIDSIPSFVYLRPNQALIKKNYKLMYKRAKKSMTKLPTSWRDSYVDLINNLEKSQME